MDLSARYTQPPADLWPWFEEYLDDEEVRTFEPTPSHAPHLTSVCCQARSASVSSLWSWVCGSGRKKKMDPLGRGVAVSEMVQVPLIRRSVTDLQFQTCWVSV